MSDIIAEYDAMLCMRPPMRRPGKKEMTPPKDQSGGQQPLKKDSKTQECAEDLESSVNRSKDISSSPAAPQGGVSESVSDSLQPPNDKPSTSSDAAPELAQSHDGGS